MRYLSSRALAVIVAFFLVAAVLDRYAYEANQAQVPPAATTLAQLPHGEHTRSITVDGRT